MSTVRRATQERHTALVALLERGVVGVETLATTVGVSASTVRRGLAWLEAEGRIARTYGGALVRERFQERSFSESEQLHQAAKSRIAEVAVELVPDGAAVFLDAGTTRLALARLLLDRGPRTVFTRGLEPRFRRSHGSLYKALDRGGIDAETMRGLLAAHRPADWPLVFAVDESTWPRCNAETGPERGFYYSASKHSAGQPIVPGWSYQWITQLDWACDSWTAPLDAARIAPSQDKVAATATQIRDLVGRLGESDTTGAVPTFCFDAGYDAIALTHELAVVRANLVVRIRDDRVFYADPEPAEPGALGRPRRHGQRRSCAEPESWPTPDHEQTTEDDRHGTVHVHAWRNLHPRLGCRGRAAPAQADLTEQARSRCRPVRDWAGFDQPPIVTGTVMRVEEAPRRAVLTREASR